MVRKGTIETKTPLVPTLLCFLTNPPARSAPRDEGGRIGLTTNIKLDRRLNKANTDRAHRACHLTNSIPV